ncbi:MAG: lysine 2,3-aminomutase [Candidatus Nealsonbacteria bacterium CG_4_9_14_0_2_um_filter_37_38]|uniref:Lysine 2,3-aminomutase n=1 Tax=Candidatus Nealsonbacteria bacterium CG_4_10_14_0_8_um_filter_37_14 TaxID=1974684 RepID=A0A2M7R6A6_9BACT|nr:MAG: lysine 2,3-aminomutase [Candidatus Nealsonbacteria bacterium CG11_big_fil_rev_8_21_14_0_20_37_68]PIY89084.1 MAG: lysine 2,3-aminomutase [Candidatus Nealsonbacteria bacterium CG_4_10_14_0_8_um_filter_37_14]PJC51832.1 MAG: lysine 2,3-aminomutase [Candidatus Nealsonbacteria bacterium CG_4_9_14_0_2_um_filter_37_38]
MLVKISSHLRKLAKKSSAVGKQFFPSPKEKEFSRATSLDPLLEEKYKKVKGLIHKYPKRVLIELTLNCASFCRFCTRRREVSDIKKGEISPKDIEKMIDYIKSKPTINEAIFSGGDPLTVPELLISTLRKFSRLSQIKIIRVHTRVPVSNPRLLTKKILAEFTKINRKKTFYLSIHIEHPDELTPQTLSAIKALKKTGAILLSQAVFLRGINDSYKVLADLFTKLSELGVRPYYIFHCDLVKGIEHFIAPIEKEIKIMTKLRKNLSGIAFPFHVIDAPNGSGKIPAPLNFWNFNTSNFTDFLEKKIKMY